MIRPLLLVVSMVLAGPVLAHHATGTFDTSQTVTFPGATLTRLDLINPHSWIYFDAVDADGNVQNHRCEMRSAHVLRRSGWSPDLFPAGLQVTIEGAPDRYDPNSCYLEVLTFEDGTRMERYGQYERTADGGIREIRGPLEAVSQPRALRLPTGEPNISGDWAPEQLVIPAGAGLGLVPLGQLSAIDAGERPTGGGLDFGGGTPPRGQRTAAGARAVENYGPADNPLIRCESVSIIFDWNFDGPINRITQEEDRIVLLYGQHGLERTIHMDLSEHPDVYGPTRTGHSIGHWDDDVLVVDTVGFLPGFLSALGAMKHTNQLHVVERFSLNPETMALTREFVAEDPIYIDGQYTGSDIVYPAESPYAEDVCNEQGFINYSEEVSP